MITTILFKTKEKLKTVTSKSYGINKVFLITFFDLGGWFGFVLIVH